MTKSRDILKGKVKRLLREQDDMGQLCDPAVQHCVSALEAFVHDLGRRMARRAEATGVATVTPIELKQCVLESDDLSFLHDKVRAIDESEAKYHKPTPRKRKAPTADAKEKPTAKPKKKKTSAKANGSQDKAPAALSTVSAAAEEPSKPTATAIEEDDNYDSSDSD